MDEKSLPGLLSHLIPAATPNNLDPGGASTGEPTDPAIETLKAVAELAGGPVEGAVNEFLDGKGALHETTRTALTRGGSAVDEVAAVLTTQFKLSAPVANLIAALLVRLVPSIGKGTGKEAAAKKKPRRKAKPKPASSAKTETGSSRKKPKKKAPARPKTSKTPAKKKTSSKAAKKSSKSTAKTKKAKRTTT